MKKHEVVEVFGQKGGGMTFVCEIARANWSPEAAKLKKEDFESREALRRARAKTHVEDEDADEEAND